MHGELTCCAGRVQAARDALAGLHGEPRRAQLGEDKHADAADSLHTHTQQTVLDSLVRMSSIYTRLADGVPAMAFQHRG